MFLTLRSAVTALIVLVALPAVAAEGYYLRTEQSRWITSSGEPLQGVRMSDRLICKEEGRCYDLRYVEKRYPYGLSEAEQRQYQEALRQLDFNPDQRATLPAAIGQVIYRAAERKQWKRFSGD